jgi:adenine phosphoribosyltransferase
MIADDLRRALRTFPDFPAAGVLFQDVAPILRDPILLSRAVDAMAEPFRGKARAVAGVESRGFILGVPVALRLGVPFVPVRKAGKLPGPTLRESYDLEYAKATLEVQRDAFEPGAPVLIVDDVLATGGTALAASRLVEMAGAEVAGWSFLLEIAGLGGRGRLGGRAHALVTV